MTLILSTISMCCVMDSIARSAAKQRTSVQLSEHGASACSRSFLFHHHLPHLAAGRRSPRFIFIPSLYSLSLVLVLSCSISHTLQTLQSYLGSTPQHTLEHPLEHLLAARSSRKCRLTLVPLAQPGLPLPPTQLNEPVPALEWTLSQVSASQVSPKLALQASALPSPIRQPRFNMRQRPPPPMMPLSGGGPPAELQRHPSPVHLHWLLRYLSRVQHPPKSNPLSQDQPFTTTSVFSSTSPPWRPPSNVSPSWRPLSPPRCLARSRHLLSSRRCR
jgi:hypothetical protein